MAFFSKALAVLGALLIAISISPSGDKRDASKSWLENQ